MLIKTPSRLLAGAAALPLMIGLGTSEAQAQSEWEWNAAIYLWGADLGAETESGATAEISFDTLLENLNFGAMAAVGAKRDEWTLFGDFIYLNVNTSEGGTLNIGPGPGVDTDIDIQLAGFISTLGAAYEVASSPSYSFNVLGGARYLWIETEVNASVGPGRRGADGDDSAWDAVVGFRGTADLNENWYLTYYADVGAGQSELTWQALATVNYRLENVDLAFGYRYTEWQFDDFSGFERLEVSGPFAGVRFSF